MDAFVFTKYESAKNCVLQTSEINFGKIICKLREYLNMVFWNLAQDLMDIISRPFTRGCNNHFECRPTLSR